MSNSTDLLRRQLSRVTAPLAGEVLVVLDLSGEAAAGVMSVRRRVSYDYLGALPVEMTVAGSGGIGSPTNRDEPQILFAALDSIAQSTVPIRGRLAMPLRFPGSDVFVLQPEDPEPFVRLHQRIKNCGVEFEPSPFDFVPHCTLSQKPEPSPDEVDALLSTEVTGEFVASTLSLYEMEAFPLLRLRWRGYLT
jgi:2'-5' RNA ligase